MQRLINYFWPTKKPERSHIESQFDLPNVYVIQLNTPSNDEIKDFLISLNITLMGYNSICEFNYWRISIPADKKVTPIIEMISKQSWCKNIQADAVVSY